MKLGAVSETTASGLIIPESARDTGGLKVATVVAVGDEKIVGGNPTGMRICPDDKVLVDPLGATKVKLLGDDLLILRIEDIVGRLY